MYVLVIAKNGPKLQEAKPGDAYPKGMKDDGRPLGAGMFRLGRYAGGKGELVGQGSNSVRLLSENILNRSVSRQHRTHGQL